MNLYLPSNTTECGQFTLVTRGVTKVPRNAESRKYYYIPGRTGHLNVCFVYSCSGHK